MTKADTAARNARFEQIAKEADAAGFEAAEAATPAAMIVTQRANPFDDTSEIQRAWHVPEGVCGFAWVSLAKSNDAFARWAKRHAGFRPADPWMGVYKWVSVGGQSYERKIAYATAYAKVLADNGIGAYGSGRLD